MYRTFQRLAPFLFLALLVPLTGGCGSGGTGTVSGKITVNGQPLARGMITFLSDVGKQDSFNASIEKGEYKTDPIPAGKARINITGAMIAPAAAEGKGGNDLQPAPVRAAKTPEVPAKYGSWETSGLSIDVKRGENTFSMDLKP